MTQLPKVLLATLSFRVSERTGRAYCFGWLGKSKLIGFPGEPDKHGNKTINLFLQAVEEQREPRRELVPANEG